MSSVITTWHARSANRARREEMTRYIVALGQQHQMRRAQAGKVEVPLFSKIINGQRAEGLLEVPAERLFQEQVIEGRILVNFDLFPKERPAALQKTERGKELFEKYAREATENWAFIADRKMAQADAEARGLKVETQGEAMFVVLERATLSGADFQLFDPRDLYPGEDRMSFNFVDGTGWPLLDGMMVHVDDGESCRRSGWDLVNSSDWQVSLPFMHLRYFMEEWSDKFFAWLGEYFVRQLDFWRYELAPNLAVYSQRMSALEKELGKEEAKEAWFKKLLAEYDAELEEWLGKLAQWAQNEPTPAGKDEP